MSLFTDTLTGLPNRRALCEYIESRSASASWAVLVADVDGLAYANGALGHLEGDRILKVIARHLKSTILPPTFVARIAGDEFVVFAPSEQVNEIADQLHCFIRPLFVTERREAKLKAKPAVVVAPPDRGFLTFSIGIARPARIGAPPEDWIQSAEHACVQAKMKGRDCTYAA